MKYANCINCFAQLNGDAICARCGFDNGAYVPEPHHLPPGSLLRDRYMIGKALGQGGFGITYAGFDTNLNRRVAIKEYFPEGTVWRDSTQTAIVSCYTSESVRERYSTGIHKCMNEAQSLAMLDDIPGIVRVLDYFKENNTAYIIMEFVEGVTLKAFLKQLPARMTFPQAVELLSPVGKALEEVHRRGFVHRDISPDNIMIDPNGKPKLLDFGAVKMVTPGGSATENPVVKRGFSPIEMYSTTGRIGPWSDVYAYCATLYYMLTGKAAQEPMDRMERDTLGADLAGILPPAQRSVLESGLALQPNQRYQGMPELLAALTSCRNDSVFYPGPTATDGVLQEPVPTVQTPPRQPTGQKGYLIKPIAICIAVAAVVLWILIGIALSRSAGKDDAPQPVTASVRWDGYDSDF